MKMTWLGVGAVILVLLIGGVLVSRSGEKNALRSEAVEKRNVGGGGLSVRNEDESMLSVDVNKSKITWRAAKKVGATHFGTVGFKSGTVEIEEGRLVGAEFVVDMNSIQNSDLEGAMKEKLEGHLKSDDFFGVDSNPTASFIATDIDEANLIVGDLTIKGVTRSVEWPASVNVLEDSVVISGQVEFNRADFDVRFGSDRFFDNLGDGLINDEVQLEVDIVVGK